MRLITLLFIYLNIFVFVSPEAPRLIKGDYNVEAKKNCWAMKTLGLESEEAIQRKLTESLKYNSLMFWVFL